MTHTKHQSGSNRVEAIARARLRHLYETRRRDQKSTRMRSPASQRISKKHTAASAFTPDPDTRTAATPLSLCRDS